MDPTAVAVASEEHKHYDLKATQKILLVMGHPDFANLLREGTPRFRQILILPENKRSDHAIYHWLGISVLILVSS